MFSEESFLRTIVGGEQCSFEGAPLRSDGAKKILPLKGSATHRRPHSVPPRSHREEPLAVLIGDELTYRIVRFFSKPVVAAVVFNAIVMVTHIPGVVNTTTVIGPLHFALHLMLVLTAVLAWMPVVGPLPELQMRHGGKMIYLFLFSVVPTVPAAWLWLAERPVYAHYGDQPVRVWNIDAINDQQVAGLIMKVGGGFFLWTIMIYMFFKRFGRETLQENSYRRPQASEPALTDDVLTYDVVTAAFDASKAPVDH